MKKEKLYKGRLFEVNAYNMQVEHRKVRREVIEHPGAAAMLAFDMHLFQTIFLCTVFLFSFLIYLRKVQCL